MTDLLRLSSPDHLSRAEVLSEIGKLLAAAAVVTAAIWKVLR